MELRRRRDAVPLPTSRHDGRITNFADSFCERLEPLRSQLKLCRIRRENSRIHDAQGDVLLIGRENFDFDRRLLQGVSAVVCAGLAEIPAMQRIEADIYAEGDLRIGEGTAIRAGLSSGDVTLERNSAILRWLHSHGKACLRQGASAYGRLSAGHALMLAPGCVFERLHAPRIITEFIDEQRSLDAAEDLQQIDNRRSDGANAFDASRPRLRVQGDFVLPAGETMYSNVIATGEVRIATGAHLFGSAKSYGSTIVEQSARIEGGLISAGTVYLESDSFVAGPISAEKDVRISRGSQIGAVSAPATVSANHIIIAVGCQLHGTVWAHAEGRIEA
jgi:predicted acyltransferase (DUF342 family)